MDVQTSDGHGMLLKYVSSYVTKMQDHDIINGTVLNYLIFFPIFLHITSQTLKKTKLLVFLVAFS